MAFSTGYMPGCTAAVLALAFATATLSPGYARADDPHGFLETVHKHVSLTSTVPDNGDQNPYALVVAPVSTGKIQAGDVLVDNFNDLSNLQGLGTTIVDINPSTRKTTLYAKLPRQLPQCPEELGCPLR